MSDAVTRLNAGHRHDARGARGESTVTVTPGLIPMIAGKVIVDQWTVDDIDLLIDRML